MKSNLSWSAIVLLGLTLSFGTLAAGSREPANRQSETPSHSRGEKLFNAHCARCHGIGAGGGEGPSLKRAEFRHSADDESFATIIRDGIPGTDMPGTWQLSEREIQEIITYVNAGRTANSSGERPTGNPDAGKRIYEAQGCTICHMVTGIGGSIGPDLSAVGARRGTQHIRESVLDPASYIAPSHLLVEATSRDGETVRGIRASEDAFTIQIRDESGQFHSFDKAALRKLDKQFNESLMPNYRSELNSEDLNDLLTYLVSLGSSP